MDKLKPCPFCGGDAQLYNWETDNNLCHGWYRVSCIRGTCGTDGPMADSTKKALKRWDTRASGWIPVEDGLPELNQSVDGWTPLACNGETNQRIENICWDPEYKKWVCSDYYEPLSSELNITHWMPQPEPPEGEI